jgi:ribosomal protein L2
VRRASPARARAAPKLHAPPTGGGEGKSKGHLSQSFSGVLAKGYKTRRTWRPSDKLIHLSRSKARAQRKDL